jgi:hypothetical protein
MPFASASLLAFEVTLTWLLLDIGLGYKKIKCIWNIVKRTVSCSMLCFALRIK